MPWENFITPPPTAKGVEYILASNSPKSSSATAQPIISAAVSTNATSCRCASSANVSCRSVSVCTNVLITFEANFFALAERYRLAAAFSTISISSLPTRFSGESDVTFTWVALNSPRITSSMFIFMLLYLNWGLSSVFIAEMTRSTFAPNSSRAPRNMSPATPEALQSIKRIFLFSVTTITESPLINRA